MNAKDNTDYIPTHEIEVKVCISKTANGKKEITKHLARTFRALAEPSFDKQYDGKYKANVIGRLAEDIAIHIEGEL